MTLLGDGVSVGRACELAGVSRAGYYREWAGHEPRQEEVAVNRKRVQRLMRAGNLLVLRKRRWVAATDSRHAYAIYPNLAAGREPAGPDELWVADITYIRLREAFV